MSLYRLALSISAAAFAACGGSQPPIGARGAMPQGKNSAIATHAQPGGSWILPEAKGSSAYDVTGSLLFVTNYTYNSVTVYHANAKNPAPIATISNGLSAPAGNCVDGQGTLYVTNQPASNGGWVAEYLLGKIRPSKVITKGINTAAFCAVDSKGNLWVTNIGGANATEYLHGSKTPHTVITQGLAYPVGIAIDRSDNLYVADRANSDVVVYAPGSKSPSRTITDGVTSPVGIAIDLNGVLYVENITEKNVEEYRQGGDHPFKTITQDLSTPTAVAVNKKGWLYVANGAGAYHNVVEFSPGSITPSKRHINKGVHAPSGLALFPPVLP
jgi:trimeric autotransporter adhesin